MKIFLRLTYTLTVCFLFSFSLVGNVLADQVNQDEQDSIYSDTVWYQMATGDTNCASSGVLPGTVPEPYNSTFTQAAAKYNMSPALLAAIFNEEHGMKPGDKWPNPNGPWKFSGVGGAWPDGAGVGARGPFQFEYTTWWNPQYQTGYVNSNSAHHVNTRDLVAVSKSADDLTDAAFGAAKLLASNGAGLDQSEASWRKAIFQYNHADWYVNAVMSYYKTYAQDSTGNLGSEAACVGSGVVVDGHVFPLPLKRQSDYSTFGALSPMPCTSSSCHHDGTPAIDMGMKGYGPDGPERAPVLAISDGSIKNVNYDYDNTGCNSIEFQSSDGYVYWYGHLVSNHSIKPGQQYNAGQIIGNIGPRKCTGNGSMPHLHIDRGSPKGADGGFPCCRDPGINPLLNSLFEAIPK